MNMQASARVFATNPPKGTTYIKDLTHKEALHLWSIGHKKGVIARPAPKTPPPFPRLLDYLERQDYNRLILALASDPSHAAYSIMEKLIAKPVYMCARGETGLELLDSRNRPIVTPRGSYRDIPLTTPLKFAREFERKRTTNRQQVDNRVVVNVLPNPKKIGTTAHEHYNLYTPGKSVSWHVINTDMTRADIRYDIKRGFVKVLSPAEYNELQKAS